MAKYEQLVSEEHDASESRFGNLHSGGAAIGRCGGRGQKTSPRLMERKCYSKTCRLHWPRGGIVGVVGPNGAGKTTLFRMIIGAEKPDSGAFTVGETVKLGYVDQDRTLDGNLTVWGSDF